MVWYDCLPSDSRGISLLLLLDDSGESAELSDSEGLEHLGCQAVHIACHLGREIG